MKTTIALLYDTEKLIKEPFHENFRPISGISANLTGTIRATRFLGNFAKYRVPFYDKNERNETPITR